MSYTDNLENQVNAGGFSANSVESIDPRDSYSARFSVTSRDTKSRYKSKNRGTNYSSSNTSTRTTGSNSSRTGYGAGSSTKFGSTPSYSSIHDKRSRKSRDRISVPNNMAPGTGFQSLITGSTATNDSGAFDQANKYVNSSYANLETDSEIYEDSKREVDMQFQSQSKSQYRQQATERLSLETSRASRTSPEETAIMDNRPSSAQSRERGNIGGQKLRSSGLDSLFAPTSSAKPDNIFDEPQTSQSRSSVSKADTQQFDRISVSSGASAAASAIGQPKTPEGRERQRQATKAYQEQRSGSSDIQRKVRVIKPVDFDCVAEISSALKAGNALVLSLKTTNPELSRRVLDFAFGAASMCGAQVSLEGEKTYVFLEGEPLNQREKLILLKQGVALRSSN